jgi:hypothetical protein
VKVSGVGCGSKTRAERRTLASKILSIEFRDEFLRGSRSGGLVVEIQEGEFATANTFEKVLCVLEITLVTVPFSFGFALDAGVDSIWFVFATNFLFEDSGTSCDLVRIFFDLALCKSLTLITRFVESKFYLNLNWGRLREIFRAIVIEHQNRDIFYIIFLLIRINLTRSHYLFSLESASSL